MFQHSSSIKCLFCILLYEVVLLIFSFAVDISPLCPDHILIFLKFFTPLMLLGNYLILRYFSECCSLKTHGGVHEIYLIGRSLLLFVVGACCFHFISFILGAPLLENFMSTFFFSCSLSSLAVFPLSVVHKGKWEAVVDALTNPVDINSDLTDSVKFISYLTIFGGWLGAFPIPLDWDRDWQTWPITCSVGSIAGNLSALTFVIFSSSSLFDSIKHKIT